MDFLSLSLQLKTAWFISMLKPGHKYIKLASFFPFSLTKSYCIRFIHVSHSLYRALFRLFTYSKFTFVYFQMSNLIVNCFRDLLLIPRLGNQKLFPNFTKTSCPNELKCWKKIEKKKHITKHQNYQIKYEPQSTFNSTSNHWYFVCHKQTTDGAFAVSLWIQLLIILLLFIIYNMYIEFETNWNECDDGPKSHSNRYIIYIVHCTYCTSMQFH